MCNAIQLQLPKWESKSVLRNGVVGTSLQEFQIAFETRIPLAFLSYTMYDGLREGKVVGKGRQTVWHAMATWQ